MSHSHIRTLHNASLQRQSAYLSIQYQAQQAVGHQSFAYILHNNGVMHTIAHTCTQAAHKHKQLFMPPELSQIDTKAGMLSGISQKHKTRSKLFWFTEFCNSQRLSPFAAPFIVAQAETSIAENCNAPMNTCQPNITCNSYLMSQTKTVAQTEQQSALHRPLCYPRTPT